MNNKLVIGACGILLLLVVLISNLVVRDIRKELETTQSTLKAEYAKNESQGTYISSLKNVVTLDERILYRYQKSINSCREATSAMIDGEYATAMLYAKDVGETEEDINPLLQERKQLLQGAKAELL